MKNGKAEIKKAVDDERKAIFSTWANVVIFIFLGAFLTFCGYGLFQLHSQKNELMTKWTESGAKSKIIKEYKKTLTDQRNGIVELREMELEWAKNKDNVQWQDREKTLQNYQDELDWAKKNFSK